MQYRKNTFADPRLAIPIKDMKRANFRDSFDTLLEYLSNNFGNVCLNLVGFLWWQLWKGRNDMVFNDEKLCIPHLMQYAITHCGLNDLTHIDHSIRLSLYRLFIVSLI